MARLDLNALIETRFVNRGSEIYRFYGTGNNGVIKCRRISCLQVSVNGLLHFICGYPAPFVKRQRGVFCRSIRYESVQIIGKSLGDHFRRVQFRQEQPNDLVARFSTNENLLGHIIEEAIDLGFDPVGAWLL